MWQKVHVLVFPRLGYSNDLSQFDILFLCIATKTNKNLGGYFRNSLVVPWYCLQMILAESNLYIEKP